jgi:hypothetical protein
MAHPLHEQVRRLFHYCCAYCGVDEVSAGGEFTVDHYHPIAFGGADVLVNLIYACFRCNQYKGDYWPTLERLKAGFFVLHPLRDDVSLHLRENETTGVLEPLTPTGAFNITLLHLNRPPLIANRLQRRIAKAMQQRLTTLEAQAEQREVTIQFLRNYVQFLLRHNPRS